MATDDPLTLVEGNDETVTVTVSPADATDDLTAITSLELILKHDRCDTDAAATTVTLTTADPAEMVIDTQTATEIEARAFIPAAALEGSFTRYYRVDALNAAGDRRTAVYGTVTVVDV